jgi:hypothetical protein
LWSSLGKKQDPISKITRAKTAGAEAQMVEHLSSKNGALTSNPNPNNNNNNKDYLEENPVPEEAQ